MSVRVVTDSTADLLPETVRDLGISVVPLSVLFGDEALLDGVDITAEQFFRRLAREQAMPTTAQPSAGAFREVYEALVAEGATAIVSCHISAALSGTLESARQAAEGLSVPVHLVDSRQVSLGLGIGVIEATRAAAAGATGKQVQTVAEDVFRRTHVFVTLDTLEYLRRGGRMSRGREMLGTLLNVKPILEIREGLVEAIGKIRTKQKAIEDIVSRCSELRPLQATFAVHATTPEDLAYVDNRMRGIAPDAPFYSGRMTPVIGVHGGPGALGIGVVRQPDEHSPAFLPR